MGRRQECARCQEAAVTGEADHLTVWERVAGVSSLSSQDTRGSSRPKAQITPIGTGESCWEVGGGWEFLEASFIFSVKQDARVSAGREKGRRRWRSEEGEEEN